MKKLIYLLALTVLIMTLSIALFSCEEEGNEGEGTTLSSGSSNDSQSSTPDGSDAHVHTYEKGWKSDDHGHYRSYICHPDIKDYDEHFDTVDRDGLCDVCQYQLESSKKITVIVQDQAKNPVVGAEIKLYTQTVEYFVTTDENGICSSSFVYINGLRAMVISLPSDEYRLYDNKSIFSIEGDTLTITVERK